MAHSIRGVRTTQAMVADPVQWQVLLALSRGPQTWWQVRQQLAGESSWQCWRGLWHLQQRQLVVFQLASRDWQLTAAGETLQPILTAIQNCTATQKGGK